MFSPVLLVVTDAQPVMVCNARN